MIAAEQNQAIEHGTTPGRPDTILPGSVQNSAMRKLGLDEHEWLATRQHGLHLWPLRPYKAAQCLESCLHVRAPELLAARERREDRPLPAAASRPTGAAPRRDPRRCHGPLARCGVWRGACACDRAPGMRVDRADARIWSWASRHSSASSDEARASSSRPNWWCLSPTRPFQAAEGRTDLPHRAGLEFMRSS